MKRPVNPAENWIEAREKRIAAFSVVQEQIFKAVEPPGLVPTFNALGITATEEIHDEQDLHIRWMDVTQDLVPLNPIINALRRESTSRLAAVPLDILQYVLNPYMCAFVSYGDPIQPPADNPRAGMTWNRARICLPGRVEDCVHPAELVTVPASRFQITIDGTGLFDFVSLSINADNTWMIDVKSLASPDTLLRLCNGTKCLIYCRRRGPTKALNLSRGDGGCSIDTGLMNWNCITSDRFISQYRGDSATRTEIQLRGILSNVMHDPKCPMTRGRVFSPEVKCGRSCVAVSSKRPPKLKVLATCMDTRGTVCVAFATVRAGPARAEYYIAIVRSDGNIAYRFLSPIRPAYMSIDARGDLVVIGTPFGGLRYEIVVYHIGMPIELLKPN